VMTFYSTASSSCYLWLHSYPQPLSCTHHCHTKAPFSANPTCSIHQGSGPLPSSLYSHFVISPQLWKFWFNILGVDLKVNIEWSLLFPV
jgi:hypothetical protein